MPTIPSSINGVTVEFSPTVNKEVDQRIIDALEHCIKTDIAPGHILSKIFISSANDSHNYPSRHVQQKAVDISRINGTKMGSNSGYSSNATIAAIVDAIQDTFETYAYRRENFGPHLKKKSGQNRSVNGHNDHIHLSVD